MTRALHGAHSDRILHSAAIVCQGHTCWHVHEAYDFPHEAGVVVHEDNWHWGPRERYSFREHEGRGYWRGGRWVVR
jgi:hypothetical protein